MGHLSEVLSGDEVETITRLLDMAECSSFDVFEASVGGLTVRVERALVAENPAEHLSIYSPAVGVYRAANEMLSVGKIVEGGMIAGHIETLDHRTNVVVNAGGSISGLFVQDGQFVEYGQRLLSIASITI